MITHMVKLLLALFVFGTVISGCSHTVYVTQQQQTFHDHEAMKHKTIVNKTKKPKKYTRQY